MKHLILFENFALNELILHGITNPKRMFNKTAILVKGDLWVIDYKSYKKFKNQICQALNINPAHMEEIDDLLTLLKTDEFSHVVYGDIDSPYLEIEADRNFRVSRFSPDVQKLMKALKLTQLRVKSRDYVYGDINVNNDEPVDPKQKLRDAVFYHGTCLHSLLKIQRNGITPRNLSGIRNSYNHISHMDKVFVTLNLESAYGHSLTSSKKHNSFPVILELHIPDVSKLVVDYDIAMKYLFDHEKSTKLGYKRIANQLGFKGTTTDIHNIENKLGEFAYQGRIPASFIQAVRMDAPLLPAYLSDFLDNGSFDFEEHYDDMQHEIGEWESFQLADAISFIKTTSGTTYKDKTFNLEDMESEENEENEDDD